MEGNCLANILICDDEPNIRETINDILTDEGHVVYNSASGLKGLSICSEKDIDVAIIDIWMPGLTGIDVLQKITDMDLGISVVIISGHQYSEAALKFIKAYAFDFLEKPLSINNLLKVVNKALKIKKKK